MRGLDEKAVHAKEKKGALGPDIDLDSFYSEAVHHDYIDDLGALSEADKKQMILSGLDFKERERSGSFVQKDRSVLHAHSKQEGLEVIPNLSWRARWMAWRCLTRQRRARSLKRRFSTLCLVV